MKKTMKRTAALLAIALLALCLAACAGEEAAFHVTVTVECQDAVEYGYEAALAVSEDGLLAEGAVGLAEGGTALDALRGTALVVATEDSAYGEYVVSVASLAQGDCGGASGWTFTVNGEYPETSAGETVLQEGDEAVWAYYCEPQA